MNSPIVEKNITIEVIGLIDGEINT